MALALPPGQLAPVLPDRSGTSTRGRLKGRVSREWRGAGWVRGGRFGFTVGRFGFAVGRFGFKVVLLSSPRVVSGSGRQGLRANAARAAAPEEQERIYGLCLTINTVKNETACVRGC